MATKTGSTNVAVRRIFPRRAMRLARKIYHLTRGQGQLLSLKLAYRKRYGRDFVYVIHQQDEMFRVVRRHVPLATPSYALLMYLVLGELMLSALEDVLRDVGRPLHRVRSFLDFACGHGRLTRFLVHKLEPRQITVADINRGAVDFTRSTFGVNGFHSVQNPDELTHNGQYEVIFAASLFSHLSISYWGAWLKRLYGMLEDGGLLVFSTHGPSLLENVGAEARKQLETNAEGFWFLRTNETEGRLAVDYYGTAYVTEAYVESFVAANKLGNLVGRYPLKLCGLQDVYALEKTANASRW